MQNRVTTLIALLLVFACTAMAGEKALMHCFVFTPVETATDSDWKAFYAATDQLPSKVPGVLRVWYGPLARPLGILGTDRETSKKLAGGETGVTGPVTRNVRKHGVCMEMRDEAALKAYADHPYHKEWVAAYSKVRVEGTTTFDILGK